MTSHNIWPALFGVALLAVATAVDAAEPKRQPSDPAAPAPGLEYRSAFSDYKKPRFEAAADWRKTNDVVREVGGFAGALKEDGPAAAMPAEPPPADGGHAGHKH